MYPEARRSFFDRSFADYREAASRGPWKRMLGLSDRPTGSTRDGCKAACKHIVTNRGLTIV